MFDSRDYYNQLNNTKFVDPEYYQLSWTINKLNITGNVYIDLPEAESECLIEGMTYKAELDEAMLFVEYDSASNLLIVKADSLEDMMPKTYEIVLLAEDEC